jgi:hypothetical protein
LERQHAARQQEHAEQKRRPAREGNSGIPGSEQGFILTMAQARHAFVGQGYKNQGRNQNRIFSMKIT